MDEGNDQMPKTEDGFIVEEIKEVVSEVTVEPKKSKLPSYLNNVMKDKAPEFKEIRPKNKFEEELARLISQQSVSIKVVGCGGSGNNTITSITEVGIVGATTLALNTDAQHLLSTKANQKILIGKELTKGRGAGSYPEIGEKAARESLEEIKKKLQGTKIAFLTSGLGGGTGTGSIPVVAEICRNMGILTIGIVTLPFQMEGNLRFKNAMDGFNKLKKDVDTLLIIPNDKLLELAPKMSLRQSFKIVDTLLVDIIKGIIELITKPGLVNLDYNDLEAIMKDNGIAMIGIGESDTTSKVYEAVEKALKNPLLDVNIKGAKGVLINIRANSTLTLDEAHHIVESINEQMDEDAKICWGVQIDDSIGDKVKVMIIVTGIKFVKIHDEYLDMDMSLKTYE